MEKLKGKITIGRVTSNKEDSYIEIELRSAETLDYVAVIKMSLETLGMAITGRSFCDCLYSLNLKTLKKKGK
jgi:hypothetical protein